MTQEPSMNLMNVMNLVKPMKPKGVIYLDKEGLDKIQISAVEAIHNTFERSGLRVL